MTHKTYEGINTTPFKERYHVLRAETVKDIEALRAKGLTFQQVGDLMGMTRTGVNNFLKEKQYRPVKK